VRDQQRGYGLQNHPRRHADVAAQPLLPNWLPDGSSPYAGLVQATDGNLYGTTVLGGAGGEGTIFKITPSGTLLSFAGTDGAQPYAGLIQATDGNLYGTTKFGGANNDGTIFKITLSGTLTTLHSFDATDGSDPYAGPGSGRQWQLLRDDADERVQYLWHGLQAVGRSAPVCGNADHLRQGGSGRQDSGNETNGCDQRDV
jgi:uncharacterized repeat protein (TIGR03803 family)